MASQQVNAAVEPLWNLNSRHVRHSIVGWGVGWTSGLRVGLDHTTGGVPELSRPHVRVGHDESLSSPSSRTRSTTVSTWTVWGNMSTGWIRTTR